MKKKGNVVLLGCGIVFLLVSLLGCKADPQMYSVTLDSQDGSDVARQTIQENGKATKPADPTKTGYVFDNWYTDSTEGRVWDFGTAVTGDMTLYAKWRDPLVTFDSQEATTEANPTSKTVTSPDTTVVLPTKPAKTGYIFGGWFTEEGGGGTEFTADTIVTEDITLYAKWTVTVTFASPDATTTADPTSMTVTFPATTIAGLPTPPEKAGYVFQGWYTAVSGSGSKFTADTKVTGDITVYAKWFGPVNIKELGPSGGYVFHDKGEYTDGWRYLEAAPEGWNGTAVDEDPKYVFGYYRPTSDVTSELVGTNTGIGTGKANTEALVAAMGATAYMKYKPSEGTETTADYAAKVCADYRGGGHDDWFLPSQDELNQMYLNLKKNSLGGFSDDYYWSSSEYVAGDVCDQYFTNGYQNYSNRYYNSRVRPVRAF